MLSTKTNTTLSSNYHRMNFDEVLGLDAVQSLERSRSQTLFGSLERQERRLQYKIEKSKTVWDIKPIDFSAKLYQKEVNSRHQKKERNFNQQRRSGNSKVHESVPKLQLPTLLEPSKRTENSFFTFYRPRSLQAFKVHSIREQTIQKDAYFTDSKAVIQRGIFRPIEDFKMYSKYGIEDFKTSFSPDPFNIKFKHKMLSKTLPDLSTTKQISVRTCESKPIPPFEKPHTWEKNSYLPKSAYKRGKSPCSALLQRIEGHLPWLNEKQKLGNIERPDVQDYTTEDWCRITKAPHEANGPFSLA